jgi:hypothetical protein
MSERVTVREYQTRPGVWVVDADFAHRLADELSEARERIEELEHAADAKALAEVIRIVEAKP